MSLIITNDSKLSAFGLTDDNEAVGVEIRCHDGLMKRWPAQLLRPMKTYL